MSTPTKPHSKSSEHERKRKEHSSSSKGASAKPSSSSSSGHKPPNYHIWRKDANDFLCIPQFHNNLPNVPSGPFFKNIELLHPYSDFGAYKTSSLEKNYIWQPHCGPDLGLKLDLVDQDAILIPENSDDLLDPSELRYLTSASDTRKSKSRLAEVTEKPWWLRNTTYLENDLYKTRQRPDAEQQAKRIRREEPTEGEELVGDSFEKLGPTLEKLRARVLKEKKATIEWEIPLLPAEDDLEGQFAIIHYDEHPDLAAAAAAGADAEEAVVGDRASESVILNIRAQLNDQHKDAGGLNFGASLVGRNKASKDGADGDDAATAAVEGGELYSWIRDYKMNVAGIDGQDVFIFTIKPGSQGSASASASASASSNGSVRYVPVRSKMEMRKLAVGAPHEAVITRTTGKENSQ